MSKHRIDNLLVTKGLVGSREKARVMVMEGSVLADERRMVKPSTLVREDVKIRLVQSPKFVSRGGIKLDYALGRLQVDIKSGVALDIGASNGGFTDCLLKRGASTVYAVDVGYGQLDYRLRQDSRVVVMDRVNARYQFTLPQLVDLATVDVAFISLEKVVPTVSSLVQTGGLLVVLIKPQFEAGREQVGRGGVVRDPLVHAAVLSKFICWSIDKGFRVRGLVASPILGPSGNREFFCLLRNH
ncbi:TlyA family RNA methyltransferase [Chloroflexota bacterium]